MSQEIAVQSNPTIVLLPVQVVGKTTCYQRGAAQARDLVRQLEEVAALPSPLLAGALDAFFERQLQTLKRLMSAGKYGEAVAFGKEARRDLLCSCVVVWRPLLLAEFDVYYALALIYTDTVGEGIALLQRVISGLEAVARQGGLNAPDVALLNWILGRAHNNLGYAYWMVSEPSDLAEQCQAALREFRTALTYFEASGWLEGIANTRDNMGRVYTLLGQPDHAYDDVEEGLGLREGLGDAYRCALSYNSLAIAELRFGQPDYACQLAERALDIFEKQEAQRGIGLASTTLGRVFFRLARCALDQPLACELFLRQSIQHLERAIRIFERDVNEPVRLREAQGLVAQVRRLANLCGIVGFDERVN